MHTIIANEKGSRTIEVSDEHLRILEKYDLMDALTNSSGVVDEHELDKLRYTTDSLVAMLLEDAKTLVSLQRDVLQHRDMKALGLKNLRLLYKEWKKENSDAKPVQD